MDRVVTGATVDLIVAADTAQGVVAGAAAQDVVAVGAVDGVVAVAGVEVSDRPVGAREAVVVRVVAAAERDGGLQPEAALTAVDERRVLLEAPVAGDDVRARLSSYMMKSPTLLTEMTLGPSSPVMVMALPTRVAVVVAEAVAGRQDEECGEEAGGQEARHGATVHFPVRPPHP